MSDSDRNLSLPEFEDNKDTFEELKSKLVCVTNVCMIALVARHNTFELGII